MTGTPINVFAQPTYPTSSMVAALPAETSKSGMPMPTDVNSALLQLLYSKTDNASLALPTPTGMPPQDNASHALKTSSTTPTLESASAPLLTLITKVAGHDWHDFKAESQNS